MFARESKKKEVGTRERTAYIIKRLKEGAVPKQVIAEIKEKYGVRGQYAGKLVYRENSLLGDELKELREDAVTYIVRNLQDIIQEARSREDRKSALKGLELLGKITKAVDGDNKAEVNLNFTFDS